MDLAAACLEMFAHHRVQAFGGAFHVPAAREYSCLFSWDSGYHALALRWIDRVAAVEELHTLYAANTTPEGLLAHERPLPGTDQRTAMVIDWFGPIYRPDGRSWLIDPPVAAYAAAKIFDPDIDTDAALLAAASAHLPTIDRYRTLSPHGMPVILHPLESGADASPLFDGLVDVSSRRAMFASHKALSLGLAVVRYSPVEARDAGHGFIVSDPIFCGWHLLALEEVASAWRRAGRTDLAEAFDTRASQLAEVMLREMWCEALGLFGGFDHVAGRRIATATLGGVVAAASRNMRTAGVGSRVISAHLRPPRSAFWGPFGVSFNPLDGREIGPRALLWRGDVVWGATQYWAHLVLAANGEQALAARATVQMEDLIRRSGFREYYSASTGAGYGAGEVHGFTWPALVLEMAATDRDQARRAL
jgi:hypothetical protein